MTSKPSAAEKIRICIEISKTEFYRVEKEITFAELDELKKLYADDPDQWEIADKLYAQFVNIKQFLPPGITETDPDPDPDIHRIAYQTPITETWVSIDPSLDAD